MCAVYGHMTSLSWMLNLCFMATVWIQANAIPNGNIVFSNCNMPFALNHAALPFAQGQEVDCCQAERAKSANQHGCCVIYVSDVFQAVSYVAVRDY